VLTTGYGSLEGETIIKRGQEGEISHHSMQLNFSNKKGQSNLLDQ
jgi:hypothetical protein